MFRADFPKFASKFVQIWPYLLFTERNACGKLHRGHFHAWLLYETVGASHFYLKEQTLWR